MTRGAPEQQDERVVPEPGSLGAAAPGGDPEALELLSSERLSERLVEHEVRSRALGTTTRFRVLVPHRTTRPEPDPVLWLLHGGDDDFRSWTDSGDAERLTDGLDLVVVMPDCGPGGWYTDWARDDGPAGPQQWETYHLRELRGWIESSMHVRRDRGGRAVVGLSMGGFGAMKYAARHPDQFCFAAAFSGAVDIVDPHLGLFADALAQLNGGGPGDIWGDRELDLMRWRGHNPVDLAANLRHVEVQLRTGNGQPGGRHGGDPDLIETTVHQTSTTLHRALEQLGIDHVWQDYGPGAHTWPYWQDDLSATLPALVERMHRDPGDPTGTTVLRYESDFSMWGWRVTLERDDVDLTRLELGERTATVLGSGAGVLVSPPLFAPGATVSVQVDRSATDLVADDAGRLVVPLQLDPAAGGICEVSWGAPPGPT